MARQRSFLVYEGPRRRVSLVIAAVLADLERAGWTIVRGWAAPLERERIVCTGTIASADDARRALLAAISGAHLVVTCRAEPDLVDRFVDDLRHVGPVELASVPPPSPPRADLSAAQRSLLALLDEGLSIEEAADALRLEQATAARSLAAACRTLGVPSIADAILVRTGRRP